MSLISFVPESPKFLISKRYYNEARKAINQIARINNMGPEFTFDSKFDREVQDQKIRLRGLNSSYASDDSASLITSVADE